ncbi:MAG: ATP-binding protein [Planctomycetota bacterium]
MEAAPALPSILQAFLDHEGRASKLKIALCGSAIATMKRLEGPDQPLYARRTARLHLRPFAARDVRAFFPGHPARDRARTYGVFGGLPGHLALLDPDRDFEANVAAHVLDPASRLYDEAQHMLDAFLGEAQVHYSILEAIASGQATWGGITKTVGKTSGSVSRPMDWLTEMEIVRRVVPITERDPSKTKRAVYRISDPYVTFWHRFVGPIVRRGGTWLAAPDDLYRTRIAPRLDDHMGPVFEEMCRESLSRLVGLPFSPYEVGEWWGRGSTEQIDVVAFGEGDEVLVGEVKWGHVDRHDLGLLRRRSTALKKEIGPSARMHLALFSGRGIRDAETAHAVERGEVLHFPLEAVLGD